MKLAKRPEPDKSLWKVFVIYLLVIFTIALFSVCKYILDVNRKLLEESPVEITETSSIYIEPTRE